MSAPAAPAASPAAVNIHIEIPGFQALTERNHWDACALIAEMDALNVCPWASTKFSLGASAISNRVSSWRNEYIAAGRWDLPNHGTSLKNIYWHLTKHKAHIAGYIPYSDTPNLQALHDFIKHHTLAQNPVIIQVVNAQALPKNESGVASHFVTLGGIDSADGYLVANGDTEQALTTGAFLLSLNWATWAVLVKAQIRGAIALDRSWQAPTPAPTPTPTPTPTPVVPIGLADAIASVENAQQALSVALTKLQALGIPA